MSLSLSPSLSVSESLPLSHTLLSSPSLSLFLSLNKKEYYCAKLESDLMDLNSICGNVPVKAL